MYLQVWQTLKRTVYRPFYPSVILSPESQMESVDAGAEPPCKHRHLASQSAESREMTYLGTCKTAQGQVAEYSFAHPCWRTHLRFCVERPDGAERALPRYCSKEYHRVPRKRIAIALACQREYPNQLRLSLNLHPEFCSRPLRNRAPAWNTSRKKPARSRPHNHKQ